jgi:ribosomal protein L11 methyltransferase
MTPANILSNKKSPITHLWSRLTTVRWEDAWVERLRCAGPEALVIKAFPASQTLRLQVYTTKTMASRLQKAFGGSVRPFNMSTWTPPPSTRKAPIKIAGRLRVYNDRNNFLQDQKKLPLQKSHALLIPAGMAFGTGDHATTHSCLRLLSRIVSASPVHPWSLLDLGTGSGVLALAGELFGAEKILGIDFDETCVRIAQENAEANNLSRSQFQHADILKWKPPGKWNVVAANIYSSVLSTVAPKIVGSIKEGGDLILSGLLAVEHAEIETIFTRLGMKKATAITRGKWCALHFQKKK